MNNAAKHIIPFLLLGLIFGFSPALQAQSGSESGDEAPVYIDSEAAALTPVPFVEIHLSPDGVYGVDADGNEWDFDFASETFIPEGSSKGTARIFRPEDVELDELSMREAERIRDSLEAEMGDRTAFADSLRQNIVRYRGLQIKSVTIEEGEIVEGSVSSYGVVLVKGIVEGDVTSYKRIVVTSSGIINGDARAPEIIRERGGLINGRTIRTDVPEIPDIQFFETTSYTALTAFSIILISLLLCLMLATAVMPRQLKNIAECIRTGFAKSFLIGLALWFGLGPLIVLLALTVIGIPIAVFVLPIALVLGMLVGIIGFSQYTGEKLKSRFPWAGGSTFRITLSGFMALYLSWMLMGLFAIYSGGLWSFLYTLFMVVSIVIWSFVVCTGLGAVVITRFGFRDCRKESSGKYRVSVEVGTVTPPPPPSPPPEPSSGTPTPPSPPPLKERDEDEKGGGANDENPKES